MTVEVDEAGLLDTIRIAYRYVQRALKEMDSADPTPDWGHVYADVKTAGIYLRGYADEQK